MLIVMAIMVMRRRWNVIVVAFVAWTVMLIEHVNEPAWSLEILIHFGKVYLNEKIITIAARLTNDDA